MNESHRIVCGHCNSIVGVPAARLRDGPRCPKCRNPLFAGHPIDLTTQTFDRHLANTDLPMIVDFWAEWCGPCRMMAPAYDEVTRRLEPAARFARLDTEAAQEVAGRLAIRSIPTLVVFKSGKEVLRQSGAMGAEALARWVTAAVR